MIYLDHNATTPMRPEVVEAIARASRDLPGNPSSVHAAGRAARDALERARGQVAALVGATREEIVFTSGGTEGDNLAIRGLALAAAVRGRRHLITSPIEHPAVRGAVDALGQMDPRIEATLLPVSEQGELALGDLEAALRDDTGLVTLSSANHELGNLYPIAKLAGGARARGALMHTDAVQALGKVAIDLGAWGVDAATISAHKIGGPKGVGAVYVRRGLDLPPLVAGGHQERERRPGTENLAGIVGFGVACDIAGAAMADEARRFADLRRDLRVRLSVIEGVRFFGAGAPHQGGGEGNHLPGTMMVAFDAAPGQLVAISLDLEGICISTGAACTSGSLEPSPVLRALGLSDAQAAEGLRISFGWTTTPADVARLGELLPPIVKRVRAAVAAPVAMATLGLGSSAADARIAPGGLS